MGGNPPAMDEANDTTGELPRRPMRLSMSRSTDDLQLAPGPARRRRTSIADALADALTERTANAPSHSARLRTGQTAVAEAADEIGVVFAAVRVWFALCDVAAQQDVIFALVMNVDRHTRIQIHGLLQDLHGKDVTYSFSLKRQRSKHLVNAGKAAELLKPDLAKGFHGSRESVGQDRLVSSRRQSVVAGSPPSRRRSSESVSRDWLISDRRPSVGAGAQPGRRRSSLSPLKAAGPAIDRRRSSTLATSMLAIPKETAGAGNRSQVQLGMRELLDWFRDATPLQQIVLFKEMIPFCAMPVMYAIYASISSGSFRRYSKAVSLSGHPWGDDGGSGGTGGGDGSDGETGRRGDAIDMIMLLPRHLAKQIMMHLEYHDIDEKKLVSRGWWSLIREVKKDKDHRRAADDFVLDLKAVCDPLYHDWISIDTFSADGSAVTKQVFEQNIFCGNFSVISFPAASADQDRCADFSGGNLVVTGSRSKIARLWDPKTGNLKRSMPGHAGSIQVVYVDNDHHFILTGSYDTSIRKWNTETGHCEAVYANYHSDTVTCIDVDYGSNLMVTGGKDKKVTVWRLGEVPLNGRVGSSRTRFRRQFQLDAAVTTLKLFCAEAKVAVAGTHSGTISLLSVETGAVLRSFPKTHLGPVTGLAIDANFIASSGMDRFVYIRHANSPNNEPAMNMRHTCEVLCLKMLAHRIVTGAKDGKVRIWSMSNGECIKIFRGNSYCDPVIGLSFRDSKGLCINTSTSMHTLFYDTEPINVEFLVKKDEKEERKTNAFMGLRDLDAGASTVQKLTSRKPRRRSSSTGSFSGSWRTPAKLAEQHARVEEQHAAGGRRPSKSSSGGKLPQNAGPPTRSFRNSEIWGVGEDFKDLALTATLPNVQRSLRRGSKSHSKIISM